MKFALTRIVLIQVDHCDTQTEALTYIQKMYQTAYGSRAGVIDKDRMTPNEERLSEALVERFGRTRVNYTGVGKGYLKDGCQAPITVYCNDRDFLFAHMEPHEGVCWPYDDIVF